MPIIAYRTGSWDQSPADKLYFKRVSQKQAAWKKWRDVVVFLRASAEHGEFRVLYCQAGRYRRGWR